VPHCSLGLARKFLFTFFSLVSVKDNQYNDPTILKKGVIKVTSANGIMLDHTTTYGNNYWLQKVFGDDNGAHCSMEFDIEASDDVEGYPYDIIMRLRYKLNDTGFYFDNIVQSSPNAPFAFGWNPHFVFNARIDGQDENLNTTVLTVPTLTTVNMNENGIPTGKSGNLTVDSKSMVLGNMSFALNHTLNCTKEVNQVGYVVTKMFNPEQNYTIFLRQDNKFPYVNVQKRSDTCVTIQPLTAVPNTFNDPSSGMVIMNDGGYWVGSFGVTLV
jgi:galactose mutarotase-like enzyme